MIHYDRSCMRYFWRVFQLNGSVLPKSIMVALPCSMVTMVLQYLYVHKIVEQILDAPGFETMRNISVWTGFTSLVGFLIVFRTSQGYNRFWEGCNSTQAMRTYWQAAASALCSYCRSSKASKAVVMDFKHTLVRLVSLMHAMAIAEMEDTPKVSTRDVHAYYYKVIDAAGLDDESLKALRDSSSRVELLYQWTQSLIVENIATGVLSAIPPPILSRSFQELGNGMVAFQQAMKLSCVPFPFPYAQVCDCLLMAHWMLVPIVVVQWTDSVVWSGIYGFVQVVILWALNFIAVEIENPFGVDANDIKGQHMQEQMNAMLMILLRIETDRIPTLKPHAQLRGQVIDDEGDTYDLLHNSSITVAWEGLSDNETAVPARSAWVTTQTALTLKTIQKSKSKGKSQTQPGGRPITRPPHPPPADKATKPNIVRPPPQMPQLPVQDPQSQVAVLASTMGKNECKDDTTLLRSAGDDARVCTPTGRVSAPNGGGPLGGRSEGGAYVAPPTCTPSPDSYLQSFRNKSLDADLVTLEPTESVTMSHRLD